MSAELRRDLLATIREQDEGADFTDDPTFPSPRKVAKVTAYTPEFIKTIVNLAHPTFKDRVDLLRGADEVGIDWRN